MSSKIKGLLVLLILVVGIHQNYGQEGNIDLEAIVLDEETKESLPYTNVMIEETSIGTTTNEEGKFELTVTKKYAKSNVVFSFIGFDIVKRKLQDFKVGDTIYLKPSSTSLETISIVVKNKYRELIKAAINNFSNNYPQEPTLMDVYYKELTKIDNQYTKFTDVAGKFYYSGYNNLYNDNKSRAMYFQFDRSSEMKKVPFPEPQELIVDVRDQLKIVSLRKSDNLQDYKVFDKKSKLKVIDTSHLKWLQNNEIGGGPLRLTGGDKVKKKEDFFDLKLYKHYEFTLHKKSTYNNLPVYVIKFKPKDSLSVLARYSGKITIDETSQAIISYSYRPTVATQKGLNQKFATQLKVPKSVEKKIKKKFITRLTELKDYEVKVSYSKFNSKWYLKRVNVINRYNNTSDIFKKYTATTESEFVINNLETNNVSRFAKSEVYQSTFMNSMFNSEFKYDPKFWKNFNALTPTGLMGKALKDLQSENSLEEQFQKKE